jgi:hypothetical protein
MERAGQEEAAVRERTDGAARQFAAYVASFRTLLERHLGEVDGLQRRPRPEMPELPGPAATGDSR